MSSKRVTFTARMPKEMKEWLVERAQRNERSMTHELVYILKQYRAMEVEKRLDDTKLL
jgi:hypothetical protein